MFQHFFRRLEKAKEEEKVQVESSPFIVLGRRTTESPDDYYTFKTLSRFSFHVSLPYAIQALSVVLSCCISSLRKFVTFNLTCVYPFPINTHRRKTFPFVLLLFFILHCTTTISPSTPFSWCVELNFNSSSKSSPSGLRQVCAVVQVDCREISTFNKLEGRKEGSHDVVDQSFVPICIISRFSFYIHSGILDTVIIHFHWVVFDYFTHKFLNRVLLIFVFGFSSFFQNTQNSISRRRFGSFCFSILHNFSNYFFIIAFMHFFSLQLHSSFSLDHFHDFIIWFSFQFILLLLPDKNFNTLNSNLFSTLFLQEIKKLRHRQIIRVSRTRATNRMIRIRKYLLGETDDLVLCSTQRQPKHCCSWKTSFISWRLTLKALTRSHRWSLCGEWDGNSSLAPTQACLGSIVHWIHTHRAEAGVDRCKTKWNEYMSKIVQHRSSRDCRARRLLHAQGIPSGLYHVKKCNLIFGFLIRLHWDSWMKVSEWCPSDRVKISAADKDSKRPRVNE